MQLYCFHRDDGYFYTLTLKDDATAIENAKRNSGTRMVTRGITSEVVWPVKVVENHEITTAE